MKNEVCLVNKTYLMIVSGSIKPENLHHNDCVHKAQLISIFLHVLTMHFLFSVPPSSSSTSPHKHFRSRQHTKLRRKKADSERSTSRLLLQLIIKTKTGLKCSETKDSWIWPGSAKLIREQLCSLRSDFLFLFFNFLFTKRPEVYIKICSNNDKKKFIWTLLFQLQINQINGQIKINVWFEIKRFILTWHKTYLWKQN